MIISPGAKLNLGLYITGKRQDGYHNLLTLFYPIPFSDSLEVILSDSSRAVDRQTTPDKWTGKLAPAVYLESPVQPCPDLPVYYSSSGIPVKGNASDNLCIKAYRLLKTDFPGLPAVQMHLHKSVPMGAGLGGGSADGAATLKALNHLARLQLSEEELVNYAAELGSDCPIFIKNTPQIATGKGEILSDAPFGLAEILKGYVLILICPDIHVPTAAAFSHIVPTPGPSREALVDLFSKSPEHWKERLVNDFEASVFGQFGTIEAIKEGLYVLGAAYASMTGSGSAVFGIFAKNKVPTADQLKIFRPYDIHQWTL